MRLNSFDGCIFQEETTVSIKPKFAGPLKGTNKIVEGQRAHFEIRLEPMNDPQMIVEWYFNEKIIMQVSFPSFYHVFIQCDSNLNEFQPIRSASNTTLAS